MRSGITNRKKGRVLVAMSGGVDSTVTALLLKERGYEVIGITFKTWSASDGDMRSAVRGCCTLDDIHDARIAAHRLGIPHYVVDIHREFARKIIDTFVAEYLSGRTPNPCILCNQTIKWDVLFRYAELFSCEWVATGHHARIRYEGGRWRLFRGKDRQKDQSYVLWVLTQDRLARTLMPVGEYTKEEVRALAARHGLEFLAGKPDSYEICFIPEDDYRVFLRRRLARSASWSRYLRRSGPLVTVEGELVGVHPGYFYFTIGQRRGLQVAMGRRYYVVEIVPEANLVVIGPEEYLGARAMVLARTNWIGVAAPYRGMHVEVQIRAHGRVYPGRVTRILDGDRVEVTFEEPARAVAPGQSGVLYRGEEVLGGGVIVDRRLVRSLAWDRIWSAVRQFAVSQEEGLVVVR